MDVSQIEFGIDSFGDLPRNDNGEVFSHAQAIRATVSEAIL
ncbi:MAG: putative alkanal monooxygenase, partial [Mycobacterium sp.]|nr:putative alkanal monooxygenase [Mycobacterium sp.]